MTEYDAYKFPRFESDKKDVTVVARNYFNEQKITALNRIVSMWLDFAANQTKRKNNFP
ncbi:RhuM family protein [Rodentibacter mrazii]|uniref:RhuM family protein n=1 Tax=Rodentibacter mrazii TaxID=1908257 RepID=UPI00098645E3